VFVLFIVLSVIGIAALFGFAVFADRNFRSSLPVRREP
jgi:hypothetical protein